LNREKFSPTKRRREVEIFEIGFSLSTHSKIKKEREKARLRFSRIKRTTALSLREEEEA